MKQLRIVFMGTPEFAVPSLQQLIRQGHKPVAVVTAPDKPSGRGRKLSGSPVKVAAEKANIPVLQPERLKSDDFMEALQAMEPNLFVVVAFRMLPEKVWSFPELGTFNLHASLLPDYRGAAPINWAIINGEKETGVTTFFLKHEIDTGDIILQEKEPIHEDDDAGLLYERLMNKGAELVGRTVQLIESGTVVTTPQDFSTELNPAPKIFRETCEINWDQNSSDIINFVRGLSPYPAAWTNLNGKKFKVFKVRATLLSHADEKTGKVDTDQIRFLHIKCRNAWLSIEEFQPEGKKRMGVEEYFRGNKL